MESDPDFVQRQMQQAGPALQALDQEMADIEFDPSCPMSVDAAIERTLEVIDLWLSGFAGNPILGPLTDQLKQQYVEAIKHRASGARPPAI